MNRRERTLSPTRLRSRSVGRRLHHHRPSARQHSLPRTQQLYQKEQTTVYRTASDANLIERFELLPLDNVVAEESDSIFSESDISVDSKPPPTNDVGFVVVRDNNWDGIESSLLIPRGLSMPRLKAPRNDADLYTNYKELDVRRKLEEAALSEAMSPSGRSGRQRVATAFARNRDASAVVADKEKKKEMSEEEMGQFDGSFVRQRRGISQPPSESTSLRGMANAAESNADHDLPKIGQHRSSSLQPRYRSSTTSALVSSTITTNVATRSTSTTVDASNDSTSSADSLSNPSLPYNDSNPMSPKVYQPTLDMPSPESPETNHSLPSTSACDSPDSVYPTKASKNNPTSPTSDHTAHTAESSSVDISSEESSNDGSEETDESKLMSDNETDDEGVIKTKINNMLDISNQVIGDEASSSADAVEQERLRSGGAITPRTALLEKLGCGNHHHRFARHRTINSYAEDEPHLKIVPLNHVSSALVMRRGGSVELIEGQDGKPVQALLTELEELKSYKQTATKEAEVHVKEMQTLKSQMTVLLSLCEDQEQTISEKNVAIRDLELKVQWAETEALSRFDEDLNSKCTEMDQLKESIKLKDKDIQKLKLELEIVTATKVEAEKKVDELKAWKVVTEGSMEMSCKEIKELTTEVAVLEDRLVTKTAASEMLSAEIKDFQDKMKDIDVRMVELGDENSSLRAALEFKHAEIEDLQQRLTENENESDSNASVQLEAIAQLEGDLATKTKMVTELQRELVAKDRDISILRSDVESAEEAISEYEIEAAKMDEEIALKQAEVCRILQDLVESKDHCETLKADVLELSVENSTLTTNMKRLESELEEIRDASEVQLAAEREARADLKQMSTEVADMKSKIVSLTAFNEALTTELDELKQLKREQSDELAVMNRQATSLLDLCNEQQRSIREREAEIKRLEEELGGRTCVVFSYEEDFIAKSKEEAFLNEKMEALATEIDALHTKVSCLSEMNKHSIDEVQSLKYRNQEAEVTINENSKEIIALKTEKLHLSLKVEELSAKEKELAAELSLINEEKIALASSSLDMASAFEEQLQLSVDRTVVLEMEIVRQKTKYEKARKAMEGLERALLTVEKQRKKLVRGERPMPEVIKTSNSTPSVESLDEL
eukprot:g13060.t1 g13060   contig7:794003-798765(-)